MIIFRKNAEAVAVSLSQTFVHDVLGTGNNPLILEYAKELHAEYPEEDAYKNYNNDDVSWCSLFLNWVCLKIGVKGTHSLAARSWLKFGISVIGEPQVGDIAVFWRVAPDSWQGHVAFYLNSVMRNNVKYIRTLGGNQGDQVKISEFPASQLLEIRRIEQ